VIINSFISVKTKALIMKKTGKPLLVTLLIAVMVGVFTYCTKSNQVLDLPAPLNGNELFSQFTNTPPVPDGNIDPVWANATRLTGVTEVPNPGN